ncbi:MAG: hypothetical protein WA966_04520 [Ornithinimicrobium sp.]
MTEEDRTHEDHAPQTPTPEVVRPTGISWVTITFGLICLGVSGLVLTFQLSELRVDWDLAVPAFVISAGAVLMVLGAVTLMKGHAEDEAR